MPKQSKNSNDRYDALGANYQVAEIALLNSVLKACGIADRRKRRRICEEFVFSQGVILDEGAFQESGKWYAPVLCYAELRGDPDSGFRRTQKRYDPNNNFPGYHEYALGNTNHFFDEAGEKTDFDWGPEYE
jgi:hypothetical protein